MVFSHHWLLFLSLLLLFSKPRFQYNLLEARDLNNPRLMNNLIKNAMCISITEIESKKRSDSHYHTKLNFVARSTNT